MSRIPTPSTPNRPSSPMSNVGRGSPSNSARRPESVYSASNLSQSSPSVTEGNLAETRKRQSRRDEAIRKKIESELSRKRPTSKRSQQQSSKSRPKQGTVSALRPLPALTVPHSISVADASQLCAAKRTDCVLVVDEDEHLCGIFTAKDLAFRVVGDGLDPRTTPVSAIMTPNPMVTRDSTSATDALQTMVTKGFRHLPVCNEDGDVVGLLDITKVFNESLEKLERAYGSSQKLYNALEGVQSEWGATGSSSNQNPAASGLMAYVEALREKMSFPDLGSILDARTSPATVGVKTTVREAAKLMRERRTTAVCVMENDGKKIAGIFTSKDVVLRVIAAGLDAKTCSVVRVMTPHPDVGLPTLSIQDALRKMHDGHYLNLPVVDEGGSLVGIVDVLKLTYATLEQVNSIGAEGGAAEGAGGPLWGRFFGALGGTDEGDTESIFSGGDQEDQSELGLSTPLRNRDSANSELFPNDSASVIDESELGSRRRADGIESSVGERGSEDGTWLFKFVSPSGTSHRFQARYDSLEFILEIIAGKLSNDTFFTSENGLKSTEFEILYVDEDADLILINSDQDLLDSILLAKKNKTDKVIFKLRGPKWDQELENIASVQAAKKIPTVIPAPVLTSVVEEEEVVEVKKLRKEKPTEELIFGFLKNDQLLPASVAFLAMTIVAVFTVSKVTSK